VRIGLISETHLTNRETDVDPSVNREFTGVNLILHLRDLYDTFVLDRLEQVAPVIGIQAYPDPPDPRIAPIQVLELRGLTVGMIHKLGFPETPINTDVGVVIPARPPAQEILMKTFGKPVDIVIFGDTHEELVDEQQGILFINPGSATFPGINHALGSPGTIAMLEIDDGTASARIIQL